MHNQAAKISTDVTLPHIVNPTDADFCMKNSDLSKYFSSGPVCYFRGKESLPRNDGARAAQLH